RQTAPRRRTSPRHGRRSDGDGRGSIVSRGSLFQDQLLEREVRHSLAQPVILFLEFFQPLHLIALQAAELLAPAIIRELRHADRANRLARSIFLATAEHRPGAASRRSLRAYASSGAF